MTKKSLIIIPLLKTIELFISLLVVLYYIVKKMDQKIGQFWQNVSRNESILTKRVLLGIYFFKIDLDSIWSIP